MSAAATRQDRPMLGIGLMLLFTSMASSLDAVARWFTQYYPVPELIWLRYTSQSLFMLGFLPFVGMHRLAHTQFPAIQAARGLALFASASLFVLAISILPFATAKVLGFTSPLIVTLLSVLLLGERIGARRWAFLLLGFLGVTAIVRPGADGLTWALVLPLGTATSYACYQLMTRRVIASDSPLTTTFYTAIVGWIAASALVPFFWITPTPIHLAILTVHGVVVGVGHFMQIKALTYAPASVIAPFGYASLIWAVTYGTLVFGEPFDVMVIVGGVMIAIAGIMLFRETTR
jgi:drug/metabolite transporter (DMT)-like permease